MAFHVQLAVFAKAFEKYGYDSATIKANPIDLDLIDTAIEAGDFGYIGAPLKSAWDTDFRVWNSIKALGVDSIFVGHEHCNSASITYEGVRLTYGQKSSTYDRYNTNTNGPVIGGTYINLSKVDGAISDGGLYLYDKDLGYENPNKNEQNGLNKIPATATLTELDFNGKDFDPVVTTPTIKNEGASTLVTNTANVPSGFTGGVYSATSDNRINVGVKFKKALVSNRVLGIFVKMYVNEYTVTSGKSPLLRIYETQINNYVYSGDYCDNSGKMGEWVYIDVLPLLKDTSLFQKEILPFTLLYRVFGSETTIYFDSITIVSVGEPFVEQEELSSMFFIRGAEYLRYSLKDISSLTGEISGTICSAEIAGENYSVCFSFTPTKFDGTLRVYGYASKNVSAWSGICISLTKTSITITNGKGSGTISFKNTETYNVEIGFVKLFNGNTVYVFVKVNETLIAWELVEAYRKATGNMFALIPDSNTSFSIS